MAKGIIRETRYHVECSNCGKSWSSRGYFESGQQAEEDFKNQTRPGAWTRPAGWRFIDNAVYCPECAAKFEQPATRWICPENCEKRSQCGRAEPHEHQPTCDISDSGCPKCIPYREYLEKRVEELETKLIEENQKWVKVMEDEKNIRRAMEILRAEQTKLQTELSREGA